MVSHNSSSKEKTPCRLTFGSLTTLGVLKVASTEALEVVIVKALGDDKAKAQRALGLAVKGKTLIRREAMVYVTFTLGIYWIKAGRGISRLRRNCTLCFRMIEHDHDPATGMNKSWSVSHGLSREASRVRRVRGVCGEGTPRMTAAIDQ